MTSSPRLLLFVILIKATASKTVQGNAYVNLAYFNETSNHTTFDGCKCGLYGLNSPMANAQGLVAIPNSSHLQACDYNTQFTVTGKPWIALIERGNCTFSDKIILAARKGAVAVVIYNTRRQGSNQTSPMVHYGTGNIVAIMIGNTKGAEIVSQIKRGYQVSMIIEVGKKHAPWMNHYSIFFVSVSFFIVTAATIGYFIFYSARRLRITRAQNRRQNKLKADAKKAIGQLQLRTLKQGDMELGPDGDSCAVCIEVYKPSDVVRILTCNHFFHKTCIDPWLLEHRTCPMCKCDILKVLGVEVDVEDGTISEASMSTVPSSAFQHTEEDSRSGTPSSGYASIRGADERVTDEQEEASAANDDLQLVSSESGLAVEVVPHFENPGFETEQEIHVNEIKS
ncbi:E3 ubiquitin-protein ligase RNF128 isoform X2 [Microcaecilia unicolor]|uniref:E3 ubiquitin-protein ligase RNF128 isoform X2 n=1 Tax=Microcaecilia unicolor TaxID=1415580 RepID=A0A6P7YIZ9_9AMPH|nr:E3 ubiquitin-protein ligase RNF128 isoform X2 [Microcaecilia unicolor]